MSKTPKYDAKVKAILDALKPGERVCELTGEKWEMTEEEIGWYKKFNVPPSAWHPNVRLRLMYGFASGIELWWKKHAKTGKPTLSYVHPDSQYQIILDKEWISEDFIQDAPEIDTAKSFHDQMRRLAFSVPVSALRDDGSSKNCIGVDYIKSEDSYMIFAEPEARRCMYTVLCLFSEDSMDLANTHQSRECFRTNRSTKMYRCAFAFESRDCINSTFLFDCRNCEFCFGATNQRNKKYLWFNEQLTQAEWEKRYAEINLTCNSNLKEYQSQFNAILKKAVWPENFNVGSAESDGEYLDETTRCKKCFWVRKSVDLYSCWMMEDQQDSAFCSWAGWGGQAYYTCDIIAGAWIKYCFRVWRSQNMEYCMDCYDCENCFGCVGLKKKRFCILNVQYAEDDYWQKLDELKSSMLDRGEYGEFFKAELAQNGFEYSMANVFLGYSDEELTMYEAPRFDAKRGGVVLIEEQGELVGKPIEEVPDCLKDIDRETFVGKALHDSEIDRNFSVVEKEMKFYEKYKLPFPRRHFLSRLKQLMRLANSPLSESVKCHDCEKDIITYKNQTFKDRNVMCKSCYLKFLETR